jgi:hypothetical protein
VSVRLHLDMFFLLGSGAISSGHSFLLVYVIEVSMGHMGTRLDSALEARSHQLMTTFWLALYSMFIARALQTIIMELSPEVGDRCLVCMVEYSCTFGPIHPGIRHSCGRKWNVKVMHHCL